MSYGNAILSKAKTKLLKKLGGGSAEFQLSDDGKTIFMLSGSSLSQADVGKLDRRQTDCFRRGHGVET